MKPPNIDWKYGAVPYGAAQGEYLLHCVDADDGDSFFVVSHFYNNDLDALVSISETEINAYAYLGSQRGQMRSAQGASGSISLMPRRFYKLGTLYSCALLIWPRCPLFFRGHRRDHPLAG